jgi:uncharacterized protein (TIGR00369 family)
LTLPELETLVDQYFPDWRKFSHITELGERHLTLRLPFRKDFLRAGGTVSGPAMMALVDTAAYYLTLVHAGPVPQAATANLDIHFLARPKPVDVIAVARLLRLGRRLAVSTVDLMSDGSEDVVAHATVTYALPSS